MASQLSSGDLISDRYAFALYDLASEKKLVDTVLDDLLFIQSMIKNNKDLKLVIKSPLIKSNDKLVILQNILKSKKPNELSSTFLKVLSKNKR
ncbi:F0F1 ATP synthase subunit delta, partial [Alphaproteobacteria bacterium]|nr:F0F1 ATP synthase subunit delta [Alphaproteobacteria bacterium]